MREVKKSKIEKITDTDLQNLHRELGINSDADSLNQVLYPKSFLNGIKKNELFKHCGKLSDTDISLNAVQLDRIIREEEECKLSPSDVCPFNGYHFAVDRDKETNFLLFHYRICKKLETQVLYRENQKNFLYNSYALLKQFPSLKNENIKTSISKNKFLMEFMDIYRNDLNFGIYTYGIQGVGKTHFFKLVCNKIITEKKKHRTAALISMVDLVETLKNSFSDKNNPKYEKIIQAINRADFLFFDDLGAEFATDWFYSNIFLNILDNRLSTNKATFFNSNLNLEEYEKKILKNCKNKDPHIAKRIIVRIKRLVNNKTIEMKDKKFSNL